LNSSAAIAAASSGQMIQVLRIVTSVPVSVRASLNRFQPMMLPTIAWVVETGRPALVIR
jgi:hypothetical protein